MSIYGPLWLSWGSSGASWSSPGASWSSPWRSPGDLLGLPGDLLGVPWGSKLGSPDLVEIAHPRSIWIEPARESALVVAGVEAKRGVTSIGASRLNPNEVAVATREQPGSKFLEPNCSPVTDVLREFPEGAH